MADPILRLDPERLSVEPGGRAVLTLTVTNPGTIVEGYSIDVVSTMALPWVSVEPATLSVYPRQEATAVVTFAPPSGPGAPGGSLPFGVRVWSQVDGGGSSVAEGDLDIGSLEGLQAKLVPLASTGRWSGRHTLRVSNWGNAPARLSLVPEDPAQALGFLVTPEVLDVPLGGEATARIKVRTRHPVLRGSLQRLPFQIACESDVAAGGAGPVPTASTPGRPVVDGAFNQKPILTRLVVAVAGLALVAIIAGVGWLLTRPDDEDVEKAQQPGQPSGFLAVPAVGTVTFTWDQVAGVRSYLLRQTEPVNNEKEIFAAPAADDPETMRSTIKVETAQEYCYQLVATREGAPDSRPSEEQCVTTALPPDAPAGPTDAPSIVPLPSDDGSDAASESPSPSESASTSPSPSASTTLAPSEPPLAVVYALSNFLVTGDVIAAAQAAEDSRAALAEQGVEAKVLFTDDWTVTSLATGESPRAPSYFVYVDGADDTTAKSACNAAVVAVDPTLAPNECALGYTVVAKTPS